MLKATDAASTGTPDDQSVAQDRWFNRCRYMTCNRDPTGRKRDTLIQGSALDPPRPDCPVCGTAELTLTLDTGAFTVGDLLERVVKKHLSFNRPTLDVLQLDGSSDQARDSAIRTGDLGP